MLLLHSWNIQMFEYQQNAAYCEGTSLCTVFNAHVGPPLLTSLGATLQCSDGNSLKADLHWEVTTSAPCCISVLATFNLFSIHTASHTCTQNNTIVFISDKVTIKFSFRLTCYYPSIIRFMAVYSIISRQLYNSCFYILYSQ